MTATINQNRINTLCEALRKQVVSALIMEDRRKWAAPALSGEEAIWTAQQIFALPVPTRMLRRLFEDAHKLQAARGEMLRPATVGELEWCIKNRSIGYPTSLRVPLGWLPAKEDADLRKLPAFQELKKIYTETKLVVGPKIEPKKIDHETTELLNRIQLKRIE